MRHSKSKRLVKYKIPKEITVIYGGISEEKNICTIEGKRLIKLLSERGHKVYSIIIDHSNKFLTLLAKAPKCAILCLTEDLGIQWILDLYDIKYNGSGPLTTLLSLDKILVKSILKHLNIQTPKFQVIDLAVSSNKNKLNVGFPLIVKPSRSGSSHGLSLVNTKIDLERAVKKAAKDDSQILVEEFIEGTEITIVCLGNKILGIVELDKKDKQVYNYLTKLKGHISYIEPARINKVAIKYIQSLMPKLVNSFNLRNLYRIDAIVRENDVFILEINTLPFLASGGEPFEAVRNKGLDIYDFLSEVIYDFTTHKKTRPLE